MKFLSGEKINEIRNSVDIVDVISNYVQLTPKGKNFMGICPFHDDNSPSMSVSREKKIYKCFSCGATGSVFKFIMDYENISFPEAIKKVADMAGINVEIGNMPTKFKSPLYEVYALSLKFYTNSINTSAGKEAKAYLAKRYIDEKIIKEFQIGLALKQNDALSKILLKKYKPDLLLKSGLIGKNDYDYYDLFRNRIMFPLYDLTGQVVAYSGRIYDKEDISKYFNTRETEIFKKGELLYNYHRARDEARQKGVVIVMEGFMDVIRAYSIDLKNVVATMGTAVTSFQANLIKKMAKEVILCFDGDKAGAKATISCADELFKIGVTPKVIRLENDMDPDEYILKYGKEQFLEKINNPLDIIDFKFAYYKVGLDLTSSTDLSNYVSTMIKEIDKIDDDILKEVMLKRLSRDSGLNYETLKEKITIKPVIIKKEEKPVKTNKYDIAQRNLVWYMLKSHKVIKMYDNRVTFMPNASYRLLAREISLFYQNYGYLDEAEFMDYIMEDESLIETLKNINKANIKETFTDEEINDYINVIYDYNIKSETKRLQKELEKEVSPLKKAKIVQRMIDLKKGVGENV